MTELRPGDAAPDFDLEDQDGNRRRLADLRGTRVILFFYPADFTAGWTIEACDFRDAKSELEAAGSVIFGVSPQGRASHRRFAAKHDLGYPLLVDSDLALASAYGAISEKPGHPPRLERSTFVIGADGRIEAAMYGVKASGHVDSVKESLSG